MSTRRSVFINVFVLILVQNGILAILASHLMPNWTAVMMIALAAGVIVFSVATAMMATRIAGLHGRGRLSPNIPAANTKPLTIKGLDLASPAEPRLVALTPEPGTGNTIAFRHAPSSETAESHRLQAAEDALAHLDTSLRRVAAGDLGARCETVFTQDFEGMRCDFNRALDALEESMSEITLSASALHGECAEARLRLMQERSASTGELAQLSAATNAVKDIAELLHDHEQAFEMIAAMAASARKHHADQKDAATVASAAAGDLGETGVMAASIASAMRDVAFRANMLSVNLNVASTKGEPDRAALQAFAADLRRIAEDGAGAATKISMLERNIGQSSTAAKSAFDRIARGEKAIDDTLLTLEGKVSDIGHATDGFADMVARSSTIIEESTRTVARRKDTDHALDTILARMAQEVALINRHCGRFIPVTLLRETSPQTEERPTRQPSHLRLVKS